MDANVLQEGLTNLEATISDAVGKLTALSRSRGPFQIVRLTPCVDHSAVLVNSNRRTGVGFRLCRRSRRPIRSVPQDLAEREPQLLFLNRRRSQFDTRLLNEPAPRSAFASRALAR